MSFDLVTHPDASYSLLLSTASFFDSYLITCVFLRSFNTPSYFKYFHCYSPFLGPLHVQLIFVYYVLFHSHLQSFQVDQHRTETFL